MAIAKFCHEDGDHLTLINVYNAFISKNMNKKWCFNNFLSERNLRSANSVRDQLRSMMLRNGFVIESLSETSSLYSCMILKSMLSGFFTQVAHLQKTGNYMIVKDNQVVAVHPSSTYDGRPEFLLYQDFVLTSRNFIRVVKFIVVTLVLGGQTRVAASDCTRLLRP